MQRIDVFTISRGDADKRQFNIIELKAARAHPDDAAQLQRYIRWSTSFVPGADAATIRPVLVTRQGARATRTRHAAAAALRALNAKGISLRARWFELDVDSEIGFTEVRYGDGV